MKKLTIIALIAIAVFWGCSQKDNPLDPTYNDGMMLTGFVNSSSLENTSLEVAAGRQVYVYEPYGYTYGGVDSFEVYIDTTFPGSTHFDTTYIDYTVTGAEYPTLYLLHGYGGNFDYFQNLYMFEDIMNEMIATGEIIPMLVITPDCNTELGGSFYVNSPEATAGTGNSFMGNWEDFMTTDLIYYINDRFNADTTSAMRGISGHSMGGYGAITLAMKHPELYSSVSSMSAPLSFRHFAGLVEPMLLENGVDLDSIDQDSLHTWFYSINNEGNKRLTKMMYAMGAAFSPHDSTDADTAYFQRLEDRAYFYGVDLPINYDAELDTLSTVWLKWLINDPLSMLAMGYADSLANTAIYLDAGDHDDLGLNLHMQAFASALTAYSIPYTSYVYDGYTGNPAGHVNYIAERLRVILKFHSDAFQAAMAD